MFAFKQLAYQLKDSQLYTQGLNVFMENQSAMSHQCHGDAYKNNLLWQRVQYFLPVPFRITQEGKTSLRSIHTPGCESEVGPTRLFSRFSGHAPYLHHLGSPSSRSHLFERYHLPRGIASHDGCYFSLMLARASTRGGSLYDSLAPFDFYRLEVMTPSSWPSSFRY